MKRKKQCGSNQKKKKKIKQTYDQNLWFEQELKQGKISLRSIQT